MNMLNYESVHYTSLPQPGEAFCRMLPLDATRCVLAQPDATSCSVLQLDAEASSCLLKEAR